MENAYLLILEYGQITVVSLENHNEWKLGRNVPGVEPEGRVLLQSRIVSREHGWFRRVGESWFFIDNPENLNGTFHNGTKIPRSRTKAKTPIFLDDGDILRIDNADLHAPSSHGIAILFTTTMPQSIDLTQITGSENYLPQD